MWSAVSAPGRPHSAQSGLPIRIAARLRLYSALSYGLVMCVCLFPVLPVMRSVSVAIGAHCVAFVNFCYEFCVADSVDVGADCEAFVGSDPMVPVDDYHCCCVND
jgi:hypothetical protein